MVTKRNKIEVIKLRYPVKSMTAVLFASYNLADKLEVAGSLNKKIRHVFNGEPVLFPLPADVPPEIPQIILTSKEAGYQCNITRGRLELLYSQRGKPDKELDDLRNEYLTILRSIAQVVRGEWKADVFRLGFVVRSVTFPSDPVELIKSTFIREGVLKAPRQLEVHILETMTWDRFEVNRWCRLSSVEIAEAAEKNKALSVVLDLNTIPEKRYSFDIDTLIGFYDQASTYVSNSLKMLFP